MIVASGSIETKRFEKKRRKQGVESYPDDVVVNSSDLARQQRGVE